MNLKRYSGVSRVLGHTFFWAFSYLVLLRVFTAGGELRSVDHLYNLLFHLTLFPAVYVNTVLLIPLFFQRKNYGFYFLLLLGSLILFSWWNIYFFNHVVDIIAPGYYFISYYEWPDILQFFGAYLIFSTLAKLALAWFRTENELSLARQEKLRAELEALKSQVNPHFLFNSLNNLYALAKRGDSRAPEIILRLSQVMRYMIYDAKEPKVPVEKEIEYLESYLALQRIRSDDRAELSFEKIGEFGGVQIAPLLFIPFVENAFKHGTKGETGRSFVHVKLEVNAGRLCFTCVNNKGVVDDPEMKRYGGLGLENVRKRLQLLYPEKHSLVIEDQQESFLVNLTIELNEDKVPHR